jgi:phosphatidylserine/phosphatidylglycerophosphate/cardiolipin synthase-like enzyme
MIVAVSGYGQEQDRARSKSVGFDYHVVKPIDPAALASLIGSLRLYAKVSRGAAGRPRGRHRDVTAPPPSAAVPRSIRYSAFAPATLAELAERALARAAGSPASEGNAVRLLCDARDNYPAWREAIAAAKRYILFESYRRGRRDRREFAGLLLERVRAGVVVHIIVDWLGCWRALSLWKALRDAGADVRVFNPPRLSSPLGWLSRDHRKTIVVDGNVGFVSGLCISERWLGDPKRRLEPWRDTGIEIRGPAVAALEQAFVNVFAVCGDPLDATILTPPETIPRAGSMRLHVIANEPTSGTPGPHGTGAGGQPVAEAATVTEVSWRRPE